MLRSLIDERTATVADVTVGAVVMSALIAVLYVLVLRASGVAHSWRLAGTAMAVVGVLGTLALLLVDRGLGLNPAVAARAAHPSIVSAPWALLPVALPVFVVRRVLHHRRVRMQTLLGALSAYLLIAFAFDFLFRLLDALEPTPFFGDPEPTTSFMYFSLVSITTLGFGDLAPASNLGRLLAVSEAIIGQVFLVTFVAMVVGLLTQRVGSGDTSRASLGAGDRRPHPGD